MNSHSKIKITSNRGATLAEIVVTTAVFAIISLTAVTLLVEFQSSYASVQEKIKTHETIIQIGSALKTELSSAVELQQPLVESFPSSGYFPIQSTQINRGQITPFDANRFWTNTTGDGRLYVLAAYIQSRHFSGTQAQIDAAVSTSTFSPALLSFQMPTRDRYGILYFNRRSNNGPLAPSRSGEFYGNIVDLKINLETVKTPQRNKNAVVAFVQKVKLAHFTVTVRQYISSQNGDYSWCPPARMNVVSGCTTQSTYKDITQKFSIIIRNNDLGDSLSQRYFKEVDTVGTDDRSVVVPLIERPISGVYFYKPIIPRDL